MADFSATMFKHLADVACVKSTDSSIPHGFKKADIEMLEKFKDSVFKVLMLRARRFLLLTQQEQNKTLSESDRFAVCDVSFRITTDALHREKRAKIKAVDPAIKADSAAGGHGFMMYGACDHLKTEDVDLDLELLKLIDQFNRLEDAIMLACHE